VGPWQQASLAHDVSDLVGFTTVDAGAGFDNVTAQDAAFEFFSERNRGLRRPAALPSVRL
jgi:hypothetical protein